MLMYYDARPCVMNGLFAWETYEPLKGYYSIRAWSDLTELGNYVDCGYKANNIYYAAATNNTEGAVLLGFFDDDETEQKDFVKLNIHSLTDKTKAEVYLLDEDNNLSLVNEQYFASKDFVLNLEIKLFSSLLIKFKTY